MSKSRPVSWFRSRLTTGFRELPSNAAWVVGRVREPSGEVLSTTSDKLSNAGSSVGDSVMGPA